MIRFDRSSLIAAALLLATLVLGVVGGIALDRWALRPDAHAAGAQMAMPRRMGDRFDPARLRTEYSGQLARALDLTPEQRVRVDSILQRQTARSRALMRQVAPELQRLADSTRAELRAVLTPGQWERMERFRAERTGRRGRREGGPQGR